MAINTDATFEKSALGEREASNLTEFQDTEKLLSAGITEPTGQSNLKESDSFSLNIRGTVGPTQVHIPPEPRSSPLPGASRGSAATYLWLAVLSCFCPGVPFNCCALWYASVSKTVRDTGDMAGARKYGRRSMRLSCLAILMGVAVIIFIVIGLELSEDKK
ncbi:hypothetical protein WMY93_008080 [Mugilogobius chulae]|uniref:Trafficking regulator of GLUT4 (SLC2A4) 1b n=1 Tax=Mugilogobius chulae TaxID=88201 RepID=A0AAW0PNT1_9GOBI